MEEDRDKIPHTLERTFSSNCLNQTKTNILNQSDIKVHYSALHPHFFGAALLSMIFRLDHNICDIYIIPHMIITIGKPKFSSIKQLIELVVGNQIILVNRLSN
ncbi:hypothetical protein ACJX0J_005929 [Zea mays]